MATRDGRLVIALEEHYYDPEVAATYGSDRQPGRIRERLDDVGALRLKEMDEGGIDIQVLSHGAPSTQRMDPELAVRLARAANDRLRGTIDGRPDRFAGF